MFTVTLVFKQGIWQFFCQNLYKNQPLLKSFHSLIICTDKANFQWPKADKGLGSWNSPQSPNMSGFYSVTVMLLDWAQNRLEGDFLPKEQSLRGNSSLFGVISATDTSHESADASRGFGIAVQNLHINHRFPYVSNTMLHRKAGGFFSFFFFFSASCELWLHHIPLMKYFFLTVSSIVTHCYYVFYIQPSYSFVFAVLFLLPF